jgi:flagellar assembly protein FliH
MALIKSSKSLAGGVARFVLPDLEEQARAKVAQAEREAQRIVADAQSRASEIESAAHEAGQAAGWKQGHSDGHDTGTSEALDRRSEELRSVVATFTAAVEALEAFRVEVEATATRDAVELALAIAERITKRQGAIDPGVLRENVLAALNFVGRTAITRVAVHPSQRSAFIGLLPQFQLDSPSLARAEIVDDESILPGGCRVFTSHGCVDADLQTQLDRMTEKLLPGNAGGATSP